MYVANKVIPATLEITCSVYYSYTQKYKTRPFGSAQEKTDESVQNCKATGFIINEEGYMITNDYMLTVENESNYPNLIYTKYEILLNYAYSDIYFNAEVV